MSIDEPWQFVHVGCDSSSPCPGCFGMHNTSAAKAEHWAWHIGEMKNQGRGFRGIFKNERVQVFHVGRLARVRRFVGPDWLDLFN